MNWTDLIDRVAERADVPKATAHTVLRAMTDEIRDRLTEGESVTLWGIGTFARRWSSGRTLRSIASGRKMWVGGRHVVRFKASQTLKHLLEDSGDQSWRDPKHQAAWRLAETLISDLELYARDRLPRGIKPDMDVEEVRSICAASLGDDWMRAWATWTGKVEPEAVHAAHLARAARRRWSG